MAKDDLFHETHGIGHLLLYRNPIGRKDNGCGVYGKSSTATPLWDFARVMKQPNHRKQISKYKTFLGGHSND